MLEREGSGDVALDACAGGNRCIMPWPDGGRRWGRPPTQSAVSARGRHADAGAVTPPLSFLNRFNAVKTWSNDGYANSSLLGNTLADYFDAGGRRTVASRACRLYTDPSDRNL